MCCSNICLDDPYWTIHRFDMSTRVEGVKARVHG
jgi:hypothetical protein